MTSEEVRAADYPPTGRLGLAGPGRASVGGGKAFCSVLP